MFEVLECTYGALMEVLEHVGMLFVVEGRVGLCYLGGVF